MQIKINFYIYIQKKFTYYIRPLYMQIAFRGQWRIFLFIFNEYIILRLPTEN